jgi:hypothetical protein
MSNKVCGKIKIKKLLRIILNNMGENNKKNMNKKIIASIVAIIIAVGLFYGGMKVGQAQTRNARGQFGQNGMMGNFTQFGNRQGGQRGTGTGMRGGGFAGGEILSKDDKSITVKLPNSGSQIIFLSASTTILNSLPGTANDLMTGKNITVQGTQNSDGSLTAQSIQIRPQTR